MHYQSNMHVTEGVFAWGFTINNLRSFSIGKMRDDFKMLTMQVPTEHNQLKSA